MMIPAKRKAVVEHALCVACGCCVKVCPLSAISVYHGHYAQVDPTRCVGFGTCMKDCPASVIHVEEVAQ